MTTDTRHFSEMTGTVLDCGHVLTSEDQHSLGTHATGVPFGTGYARDAATGATSCYPCAEESERRAFLASDTYTAYVSYSGYARLTTWTGGVLADYMPGTGGVSRSGWHGSEVHSWRFRASDGSEWYGRNAGRGMVITVRRARHNLTRP